MNIFQILLLGFISGLTEFMPLSATGHQRLVMHLFGRTEMDPLCRAVLSIGMLCAVFTACSGQLRLLLAERSIEKRGAKFRLYGGRRYDYRLVKVAALPISVIWVIGLFMQIPVSLPWLASSFLVSGTILFVVGNAPQGNKDSRRMTKLDSVFIGLVGCLSVIPGISLVGTIASAAILRGAQRQSALNWALIICIPVLLARIVTDLLLVLIVGTGLSFVGFLLCLCGALCAYIGGRISIRLVRFAVSRSGLSEFAYYVWGAAILTFILYLIT